MIKPRYLAAGALFALLGGAGIYVAGRALARRGPAPAVPMLKLAGGPHSPWRFPNVELTTHEGKKVLFYDDLIKGKIIALNFMYATCTGF